MLTRVMLLQEALKRQKFDPIQKKLFQETSVQIPVILLFVDLFYVASTCIYVCNDVHPKIY